VNNRGGGGEVSASAPRFSGVVGEGPRPRAFPIGERPSNVPARQRLHPTLFRRAGHARALHRQTKEPGSAVLRRAAARRFASGCRSRPPDGCSSPVKAATSAAEPTVEETAMTIDHEPPHAASPTAHVLAELQLYGWRPFQDEPDPRPLPESDMIAGAVADIFDALAGVLNDTRLEPDLEDLLWSTVNLFHRAVARIERALDDNERAQRRSQEDQDGSEVKSVELERLIAEGLTLIERRDGMELFRDLTAEHFERHTGSIWRPRAGSMVNHRALTAAMIDSRDFLAAKRRAETEASLPPGPKIAVTGGADFNDHALIWAKLDQVRAKHPDMVLLHGGGPRGAERIAACWADNRKVPQIAFRPDWNRHAKAAPFKRNDALLAALPIGVLVFPGTGIQDNLADKAKAMGIPVWRFRSDRV